MDLKNQVAELTNAVVSLYAANQQLQVRVRSANTTHHTHTHTHTRARALLHVLMCAPLSLSPCTNKISPSFLSLSLSLSLMLSNARMCAPLFLCRSADISPSRTGAHPHFGASRLILLNASPQVIATGLQVKSFCGCFTTSQVKCAVRTVETSPEVSGRTLTCDPRFASFLSQPHAAAIKSTRSCGLANKSVFQPAQCHVACDLMNWLEFLLACTVMLLVILHATHGCRPCTCKKQSFVCAELTQCESYEIHELGMKWCTNVRSSR